MNYLKEIKKLTARYKQVTAPFRFKNTPLYAVNSKSVLNLFLREYIKVDLKIRRKIWNRNLTTPRCWKFP